MPRMNTASPKTAVVRPQRQARRPSVLLNALVGTNAQEKRLGHERHFTRSRSRCVSSERFPSNGSTRKPHRLTRYLTRKRFVLSLENAATRHLFTSPSLLP